MNNQKLLSIGEVFVDTHLDIPFEGGALVRLGGIFHAARACASIGLQYALAYCAPSYLDADIEKWSSFLDAGNCVKFCDISRAPNVMLINESKELGDQRYQNLLSEQADFRLVDDLENVIRQYQPTDILLFPGRYDLDHVLKALETTNSLIHIDCAYDSESLFEHLNREIETIFLSTSSDLFKKSCHGVFDGVISFFDDIKVNTIVLKQGRGGSTAFDKKAHQKINAPAYLSLVCHSVGVGDVYDTFFISNFFGTNISYRMRVASFASVLYAKTMSYEEFLGHAKIILNNPNASCEMEGIFFPWENRRSVNIYLAAPDFPDIDTLLLDNLNECLIYQNFSPRLPIRENGLAVESSDDDAYLYELDRSLLDQCSLLIAVMLNPDPGTFVEIGMFKQMNKPVIIYDPFGYANNMFVRNSATSICTDMESVLIEVFDLLGERL